MADTRIKLVFKDVNLVALESAGRVRATVLYPDGAQIQYTLTTDQTIPCAFNGSTITFLDSDVTLGEPRSCTAVRFSSTVTMPTGLVEGTTYYLGSVTSGGTPKTWSVKAHASYAGALNSVSPISPSGGEGILSIVIPGSLRDAVITIPDGAPQGVYRITVESESQLFWLVPASDADGLVVSAAHPADIAVSGETGAHEIVFHLAPGSTTLDASITQGGIQNVLPFTITNEDDEVVGDFDYDGATASKSIAAPDDENLIISRGYQSYSHPSQAPPPALPTLRLGNAYPFVSPTTDQWFDPLATLTDAMTAFWPLDEASGAAAIDLTGNGHTLVDNGTVGTSTGKLSGCRDFGLAGSKWLQAPTEAPFRASQSFSVCGWCLTSISQGTPTYIVTKGAPLTSSAGEWALLSYNFSGTAKLWANWRDSGGTSRLFEGPALPTDNAFHFVAAVFDADDGTFWLSVDGSALVQDGQGFGPPKVSTGAFGLGGIAAEVYCLHGRLDAVAFFAGVKLTDRDVFALYNNGFGFQLPG